MENDFQNSLADTQVALITTLLKKLPWFGKQTARSLKIGKMKLFLTELFTQTFVCTDTKQLKKPWSKY